MGCGTSCTRKALAYAPGSDSKKAEQVEQQCHGLDSATGTSTEVSDYYKVSPMPRGSGGGGGGGGSGGIVAGGADYHRASSTVVVPAPPVLVPVEDGSSSSDDDFEV